jgi:hypothetical protein
MTGNTAIGGFSATYTVPGTPPGDADNGQTLFYFIGAENTDGTPRHGANGDGRTILQPVLTYDPSAWCKGSKTGWCMSSWNCCPANVTTHSTYINDIKPGEKWVGFFNLTSETTYEVVSKSAVTGQETKLAMARGGRDFNWADVTLEVYGINKCDEFAVSSNSSPHPVSCAHPPLGYAIDTASAPAGWAHGVQRPVDLGHGDAADHAGLAPHHHEAVRR